MASRQPWQSTNPNIRMTTRRIPDGTPCGYCFDEWATVWDHLQPCRNVARAFHRISTHRVGVATRSCLTYRFHLLRRKENMSEPRSSKEATGTPLWKVRLLCPTCRKLFPKSQKTQRYCSPACRKRGWADDQKKTFPCPICQTPFVKRKPHQKYCSAKCRWLAWLNRKVATMV